MIRIFSLFIFILGLIITASFQQPPKNKYSNFYLHKINVFNSDGKKMESGWRLAINAANKYTNITCKDTQNVIVSVDKYSDLILFLNDSLCFNSKLDDYYTSCQSKLHTLNFTYEYNLYIQLKKDNCTNPCGPKGVANLGETFYKLINNYNFNNNEITYSNLFYPSWNKCDYKIWLLGNMDKSKKIGRKYIRLANSFKQK